MSAPAAPGRPLRVVTLGGGHGLHAMLSALRLLDPADPQGVAVAPGTPAPEITAIVTVADDGGSSGRLRREMPDILPPGDLRMALSALAAAGPAGQLWQRAFQHRFAGDGALAGHPVGNLVLAGLAQVTGDPVAALDAAGAVLGARGRVLPMSCLPLTIVGTVSGLDEDDPSRLREIRGQVAVAATPGQVRSVRVEPADAPACPEAVAAVEAADVVVLGPGSWFTSVLPHLLLPGLGEALLGTAAHRLVVLNLAPQPGETEGFSAGQHLDVLAEHAPALRIDTVLADRAAAGPLAPLEQAAARLGAVVRTADVASGDGAPRHDVAALAAALRDVLAGANTRAGEGVSGVAVGQDDGGAVDGARPAAAGTRTAVAGRESGAVWR